MMRSLSALVLLTLAAGAGVGVYHLPDGDAEGRLAIGRAIAADATGRVPNSTPVPDASGLNPPTGSALSNGAGARVFSAQTPLYGRTDAPAGGKPKAARGDVVAETTVIGGEPIMRAGGSVGQDSRPVGTTPAEPATRADTLRSFALDLHRELKRVGCYSGEVSGEWTSASKKAMRAFLERVNARLPVESPDHILLTLVKGHSAMACGQGCAADQAADDAGKCVPRGLLVKAAPRETPRTTATAEPAAAALRKSPDRVMLSSSWTTEVAPATQDVATPMTRAATVSPNTTGPGTPVLPGRMTLGAAPSTTAPAAKTSPLTTGSVPPVVAGPPTLIQPPRPAQNRLAAATQDTPNAAAGRQAPVPNPPMPLQEQRYEPVIQVVPNGRPPQIVYTPRPMQAQTRPIIVQRSYSGSVQSYVPPSYRPSPNRDWKQTVFNRDMR